jgi:hypothetical protein
LADIDTLLKAYYSCFIDSDAGAMVMADLQNKFYKPTFLGARSDQADLFINLGGREVIVYILSMIEEFERGRGQ